MPHRYVTFKFCDCGQDIFRLGSDLDEAIKLLHEETELHKSIFCKKCREPMKFKQMVFNVVYIKP